MDTDDFQPSREKLNRISSIIIGGVYQVSNKLGSGFLEKVYENALAHELRKSGLLVRQQHSVKIWYDGVIVGDYVADLLVEDSVLVELKAVNALDDIHTAQCLNYLKGIRLPLCLPINLGKPRVQLKRIINR